MEFKSQQHSIEQLKNISSSNAQSILIQGIAGCGKSYLAKEYARMIDVEDVMVVNPDVNSIRDAIQLGYRRTDPLVIVVENLDEGAQKASHTLLKFLEEPASKITLIITCRNMDKIPSTIVSRSLCIFVAPPTEDDLLVYAKSVNSGAYESIVNGPYSGVWDIVETFEDVRRMLLMNKDQLSYIVKLPTSRSMFKGPVSNILWSLQHYEDNSDTDIDVILRYILLNTVDPYIKHMCLDALKGISSKRLPVHVVLAKFVIECRYGE